MDIIDWLFSTREGVGALLGGGVVLFLIIAVVLEWRTRQQFKNHEKTDDDWNLFDSEDGDE